MNGTDVTTNGTDLTTFTHSDGTVEKYYSFGDRFLNKAFLLLETYWNRLAQIGLKATAGGIDFYLPTQLRDMGHRAATEMEKRFAEYIWNRRTPLGLVPYYLDTEDEGAVNTDTLQRVEFPILATELFRWFFRRDLYHLASGYLSFVTSICTATKTYCDFAGGGVYPWADVTTGGPRGDYIRIQSIGAMALGMASATIFARDNSYLEWADQKLDFVWAQRQSGLPILVDQLTPAGYINSNTSDTDTLYHVRYLFEMWKLLDAHPFYKHYANKYGSQAFYVANQWYKAAWMPQFGHFSRKLDFATGWYYGGLPGSTYPQPMIYGDGKWNTLHVLVWAYRATKETKYLERLKNAWEHLLTMSKTVPGLVDARFVAGESKGFGDGEGFIDEAPPTLPPPAKPLEPHLAQVNFLDVLLSAFEASGDPYFLTQAVTLGDNMLVNGDVTFLITDGHPYSGLPGAVFLRLALAHARIRRLQIKTAPSPLKEITIESDQFHPIVLQAFASSVIYLPQASYHVTIGTNSRSVDLNMDMAISF